jgi:uncharacterized protein
LQNIRSQILMAIMIICILSCNTKETSKDDKMIIPGIIVDKVGLLTNYQFQKIENKLIQIDEETTNQIAILIIDTLNGISIEQYAFKTFNTWGIGQKDKNNGILILFSILDKKVRIEIGLGLEEVISNIQASEIISKDITPNFKQGKFYEGINLAIDDLYLLAIKKYKVIKNEKKKINAYQ